MTLQALSNAVHDFIGDGKTEEALALLKKEIPTVYPKGVIDVTLLKSRYNQLQDEFNVRGVISNADYESRVSQINFSILEFLEKIAHPEIYAAATTIPTVVSPKKSQVGLKISTPNVSIQFSKKTVASIVMVFVVGISGTVVYRLLNPKRTPVTVVQEIKQPTANTDTVFLQNKVKELLKEEAREKQDAEKQKSQQPSKLGDNKEKRPFEKLRDREKKIKSRWDERNNEMDTTKPLYAPAQKKILPVVLPQLKKL